MVWTILGLACIVLAFVGEIIDERILLGTLEWFVAAIAFNTLGALPFVKKRRRVGPWQSTSQGPQSPSGWRDHGTPCHARHTLTWMPQHPHSSGTVSRAPVARPASSVTG